MKKKLDRRVHPAFFAAVILLAALLPMGCSRSGTGGIGGIPHGDSSGWAAEPGGNLLWSAGDLKEVLDDPGEDLVLVDCRSDVSEYDSGHIPGAVWIRWKDMSAKWGTALLPLSDVEDFLGRTRGIARSDTICLYGKGMEDMHQNPFRLFWMLEYYGCRDVHVLNGGIDAWASSGFPMADTKWEDVVVTPRTFTAVTDADRLADTGDVARAVDGSDSGGFAVIDARTPAEFNGEAALVIQDRAGRIPHSRNVFWFDCFDPSTGLVKPPSEVRGLLAAAGAGPGKKNIVVSAASVRSTVLYFICRLFGYSAAVYLPGIQEWGDVDVAEPRIVERTGPYRFAGMEDKDGNAVFACASTVFGGKVWLFGGLRKASGGSNLEIDDGARRFDPDLHPFHEGMDKTCWTGLDLPVSFKRYGHMAAADPKGDAVYLFGGIGPDNAVHDEIARLDIDPATLDVTGMSLLDLSLPKALYGAGCVYSEEDGRIYIFGGATAPGTPSDTVYAFTPSSQGGPSITEAAPLPSPRSWCGGVSSKGRIFCLGGRNAEGERLAEVLSFDPSAGSWTALESMRAARMGVKGAVVHDRIYMAGGYGDDPEGKGGKTTARAESFDPENPRAGWREEEPMAVPKFWHSMEAVADRIYLFGGYCGEPKTLDNRIKFANTVVYTPVESRKGTPLPGADQYLGASAAAQGRIYLFGGRSRGELTGRVLEYDPTGDSWSVMDPLPRGGLAGAAAAAVGDGILVMGGLGEPGVSREAWLFDPAAPAGSQWTRKSDLPEARWGAAAFFFDDGPSGYFSPLGPDLVFLAGGRDDHDYACDTTLLYDAAADTWTAAPFSPLPEARFLAGGALAGEKIVLMGGMASDGSPMRDGLVLDLSNPLYDWTRFAMPSSRYGQGTAAEGSTIHAFGGFTRGAAGRILSVGSVEAFDTRDWSWTRSAGLEKAAGYVFAAPCGSGSYAVIGGLGVDPDHVPHTTYLRDVILYSP